MYTFLTQLLSFREMELMELSYGRISELEDIKSIITITYDNNELSRHSTIFTVITDDNVLHDIPPSIFINDEIHHTHSEKRIHHKFNSNNIKFIIKKENFLTYTKDRKNRKELISVVVYY